MSFLNVGELLVTVLSTLNFMPIPVGLLTFGRTVMDLLAITACLARLLTDPTGMWVMLA